MYQQENERTAGETVCACKDETNNALLHETPRKSPIACSLEPCTDVHTTIYHTTSQGQRQGILEAHALHATLFTDVCRLADSTPGSECFPPDVVIRQIGNGLISD